MSNVIERAVEALNVAMSYSDDDESASARHLRFLVVRSLAELRRYEVVEGCPADEGGVMVFYEFPTEESDEAPAILLV
jgi:hypothetical protein